MKMCILSSQSGQNMTRGDKSEKYNEYFQKNGFYVMALVLVAGILAVSGIAGYVSGSERTRCGKCSGFQG